MIFLLSFSLEQKPSQSFSSLELLEFVDDDGRTDGLYWQISFWPDLATQPSKLLTRGRLDFSNPYAVICVRLKTFSASVLSVAYIHKLLNIYEKNLIESVSLDSSTSPEGS